MHGAGNDYVYLDCFQPQVAAAAGRPEQLAPRISDRNFGVGGDGMILIMPSEAADVRMRMFNLDGSEAEMCGNGIRCVAKYAVDAGLAEGPEISVETKRGVLDLTVFKNSIGKVDRVQVNMGRPVFDPSQIPVVGPDKGPVLDWPLQINGAVYRINVVSMGNPHAVIFVDDTVQFPVKETGRLIENHPAFPERVNVEFVTRSSPNNVIIRTWERGSGETLACGTGASAVTVVLGLKYGERGPVTAELAGGTLELQWLESGEVLMTGPAVEVFRGSYNPC